MRSSSSCASATKLWCVRAPLTSAAAAADCGKSADPLLRCCAQVYVPLEEAKKLTVLMRHSAKLLGPNSPLADASAMALKSAAVAAARAARDAGAMPVAASAMRFAHDADGLRERKTGKGAAAM